MAKSIQALLGLPALTSIVEETVSGLPQEEFLPKEFESITKEIIGNSASAVVTYGQRKTTRLIRYNSAPVGAALEPIATKEWVLFHSSEEIDIDQTNYQRLRQFESWELQKQGLEEIGRQIGLFIAKSKNTQTSTTLMMIMNGLCYFDGSGNLLPTSSGAIESPGIGIEASHQNQCNYNGANLITAPWSMPSTNIPLHCRNIKKAGLQATGQEPKIAMYGVNVPGYMQTNGYMKEYLARYPQMNAKLMNDGEIPDGLLGFTWIPAWKGFYESYDGSNYEIVNGDAVTFMPPVNKRWYELLLGSMLVPTTLDIQMNVDSAMSNSVLKYGRYSYAQLEHKPIRLIVVQGHTWYPAVKNPKVLWQCRVAGF